MRFAHDEHGMGSARMKEHIHVCIFDSAEHLRGRARTYAAVKAAVLEAGRFSVFEATASRQKAEMFDRLERDPEIETFRNPPGFPWIGVRKRKPPSTTGAPR